MYLTESLEVLRRYKEVLRTSSGRHLEDVSCKRLEDVSWKTSWGRHKKRLSRLPFQTNLRRLWEPKLRCFYDVFATLCVGWDLVLVRPILLLKGNRCFIASHTNQNYHLHVKENKDFKLWRRLWKKVFLCKFLKIFCNFS